MHRAALAFMLALASPVSAADTYSVGVAKIDITPNYPIRLSGFGFRRTESEGVTQRIWAKALAIDDGEPGCVSARKLLILIAVDNCGVPAHLVDEVGRHTAIVHGDQDQQLPGADATRLAIIDSQGFGPNPLRDSFRFRSPETEPA